MKLMKKEYISPKIRVVQIGGGDGYCVDDLIVGSKGDDPDMPILVHGENDDINLHDDSSDGLSSSGSYNLWEKGW